MLRQLRHDVGSDYGHYYSWGNFRDLLCGAGLASLLANTELDEGFQGWYQQDVRSPATDDFASFWKTFGEGQIFVPVFAGLGVVGSMLEDRPVLGGVGRFGTRTTRGYLVGVPPMLMMQYLTGASRPGEISHASRWRPFSDNNGTSGHAFMGAVPFITAAQMSESRWLKTGLYFCSTLTAWSRINDDCHYLSQACLGWWMAYLACRAVDRTEAANCCCRIVPMATADASGIALVFRR